MSDPSWLGARSWDEWFADLEAEDPEGARMVHDYVHYPGVHPGEVARCIGCDREMPDAVSRAKKRCQRCSDNRRRAANILSNRAARYEAKAHRGR